MKISFFCPIWGSENLDIRSFLTKVKDAGYDGIEMSLPEDQSEREKIISQVRSSGLKFIAQHWETSDPGYEKHRREYRQRLERLALAEPMFINSQTGKDFFTFEQNAGLISLANEVSEKYGIKILHETHRGKFSFAAHVTSKYMERMPDLQLSLDISHWCNVAESWLDDQQVAVDLAISRTGHIHARVGFPEGPQVPDPRAPEWRDALNRHIHWWSRVIEQRSKEGVESFTITPEFGPYPYMTILPNSRQPVSDQWQVNVFMMEHLRSVFKLMKS